MGLSRLSSARTLPAFALTRKEIQSTERLCLSGLENLNVAFQVSLKLVYVHLIPVKVIRCSGLLALHVYANICARFKQLACTYPCLNSSRVPIHLSEKAQ